VPDDRDAEVFQVLRRQARETVSSISFSRNAASYFPRPRLRSQATMSIAASTIGGANIMVRLDGCVQDRRGGIIDSDADIDVLFTDTSLGKDDPRERPRTALLPPLEPTAMGGHRAAMPALVHAAAIVQLLPTPGPGHPLSAGAMKRRPLQSALT